MSGKHLLKFMKNSIDQEPEKIVLKSRGFSLSQAFSKLNVTLENFTLDSLELRFDLVDNKNPFSNYSMKHLFLDYNNEIGGCYYAKLVKEVFEKRRRKKNNLFEYRIALSLQSKNEWDTLAKWILNYDVISPQVQYTIEVARVYKILKKHGYIKNFQDLLDNFFKPLFEASDSSEKHPELAKVLDYISGFTLSHDINETQTESEDSLKIIPQYWNSDSNPRFSYYHYYFWANIQSLNAFRYKKGLSTFLFRPDSTNNASIEELSSSFLLADSISNANDLIKHSTLQYLFYLKQIGVVLSPLMSNSKIANYTDNPFFKLFQRGLKVSLGTDRPLQLHITGDALVEEYAIAAQMWKLSHCDLSEIARTSILNSGFPHQKKIELLGEKYNLPGTEGNDATKTNIPNIRIKFREEARKSEESLIASIISGS